MANTGFKGWSLLEEYYVDNDMATGFVKPNVPGDPDYVAPVEDNDFCPPDSVAPPPSNIVLINIETAPLIANGILQYTGPADGILGQGESASNLPPGMYTFTPVAAELESSGILVEINADPGYTVPVTLNFFINLNNNDTVTFTFNQP